jgi:hypothetical protein
LAEHKLIAMASATTRSTSVARRPSAGRRQVERLSLRRRRCERAVQRPAGSAPSRWPGREVMQACSHAGTRTACRSAPSSQPSRYRLFRACGWETAGRSIGSKPSPSSRPMPRRSRLLALEHEPRSSGDGTAVCLGSGGSFCKNYVIQTAS